MILKLMGREGWHYIEGAEDVVAPGPNTWRGLHPNQLVGDWLTESGFDVALSVMAFPDGPRIDENHVTSFRWAEFTKNGKRAIAVFNADAYLLTYQGDTVERI